MSVGNLMSSSKFPQQDLSSQKIEKLPAFRDVTAQERPVLFQRKLRQCCVLFTFRDPNEDALSRDVKKQTLIELVEYVNNSKSPFPESVYPDVVQMVMTNLLRPLPPKPPKDPESVDPEDEDPQLETAWPHLQVVYEFMLRFIESPHTDVNIAKKYFDTNFVSQILDLFGGDDPRERDYLKTTLHRIYGKFLSHRAYIRKSINNTFFRFIYEDDKHNGISELLEILGSIINGFALPLREEHKQFLSRGLLPLHKPRAFTLYHQQLTYCITQFMEKDPKLSEVVVKGLIRFWPMTNSPKELLFIAELEEILELTDGKDFQKFVQPLFRQLSKCISSHNFQVAERALFLWNNEYIVSLIEENRKVVLPTIFGALFKNSKSHWNTSIHNLTYNVLKMFNDMDAALFDECSAKYKAEQAKHRADEARRKKTWHQVETHAVKNASRRMSQPITDLGGLIFNPAGVPLSTESSPDTPTKPDAEQEPEGYEDLDQLLKKPKQFPAPPTSNMRRKSTLPPDTALMQLLSQHHSLDK
eukprot:TRINITY_DN763_c0_g1_i1.p1 TRINITY_DN763_c0_g1~~TRINITY_DN763_c0_g1_i1.p1  ORF type:complete len:528 (-),score=116.77 TRINITY_DN763_c0_g1_i1:445-2028(-)